MTFFKHKQAPEPTPANTPVPLIYKSVTEITTMDGFINQQVRFVTYDRTGTLVTYTGKVLDWKEVEYEHQLYSWLIVKSPMFINLIAVPAPDFRGFVSMFKVVGG